MRPDMNRSPLLNGIAWTGGVLGALLTLVLLLDIALKLSSPAICVDTVAPATDSMQVCYPYQAGVSQSHGGSAPNSTSNAVIRIAVGLRGNVLSLLDGDNTRMTILAPVAFATLLFAGFACAAEFGGA